MGRAHRKLLQRKNGDKLPKKSHGQTKNKHTLQPQQKKKTVKFL